MTTTIETAQPTAPNSVHRLRQVAAVAIAALAVIAAVKVGTGPADRPHLVDAASEAPSAPEGTLVAERAEEPVVDGSAPGPETAGPDGMVEGQGADGVEVGFDGPTSGSARAAGPEGTEGTEGFEGPEGPGVPEGLDADPSMGAVDEDEMDAREPGGDDRRPAGDAAPDDGFGAPSDDDHSGAVGDDPTDTMTPASDAPSIAAPTTQATGGSNRPPTLPTRTMEIEVPVGQPVTLFSDGALAAGWDDPDATSDWLCLVFTPERKDFWLDGADCTGAGLWAKVPVAGVYTVQVRVREATAAQPGGVGPLSTGVVTLRLVAR